MPTPELGRDGAASGLLLEHLVVHGPLLALLALELPRTHAPERVVRSFSYRLVRPAFLPARLISVGRVTASSAEITVGAEGADPSLTAEAGL